MKRNATIFFSFLTPFLVKAQPSFKTSVPNQPIIQGESFQVQYIIREAEKIGNFKAPKFTPFRFVSGPYQYPGSVATINGVKPVQNFVYTLEAISPGRFIIPGAMATVNGKPVKSDDVVLEVISKEKAAKLFERNFREANSEYVLRRGEDPYEKIRQNLFLKLAVDRTNCFAGEPILASFKLYSRLQSNSDIVKNPGFYGFTVYDMLNLADKQTNTETINGKIFDVHTIRKVQLYPLQAGIFTIDPMEIKNKVEFSRSIVNKKTEQEIVEGISGTHDEENKDANTEIYETNMHTEPVMIHVKPVPVKDKPVAFNGAVGTFFISASAVKNKIAKNEEGILEITIRGNGNFTQLSAPSLDWPEAIEGFEPEVRDSLDKTKLPLAGCRTFRYKFTGNTPGSYQIPAVQFSFFDQVSKIYKTVSTAITPVEISNEEKKSVITTQKKESIADKNARASKLAAGIVILFVLIILIYWIFYKGKPAEAAKQEKIGLPSIDEGLTGLGQVNMSSDKEFCTALQQYIWEKLGNRFNLDGSASKKEILFSKLKQEGVEDEIIMNLKKILYDCEMGMFTGAALAIKKDVMLTETKEVLGSINRSLL